jgi:hypothetical protein
MFDFLCGNHTRNLLVVRYEKHYDAWLEDELGEQLRVAHAASGGRVRLECSGTMFLRAICKLTHRGYSQYVKGKPNPIPITYYCPKANPSPNP